MEKQISIKVKNTELGLKIRKRYNVEFANNYGNKTLLELQTTAKAHNKSLTQYLDDKWADYNYQIQ